MAATRTRFTLNVSSRLIKSVEKSLLYFTHCHPSVHLLTSSAAHPCVRGRIHVRTERKRPEGHTPLQVPPFVHSRLCFFYIDNFFTHSSVKDGSCFERHSKCSACHFLGQLVSHMSLQPGFCISVIHPPTPKTISLWQYLKIPVSLFKQS